MAEAQRLDVDQQHAGKTLAAFLRAMTPGASWSDVRRKLASRHILVNDVVCLDDARRLRAGDRIQVLHRPARPLPTSSDVRILREDDDLLVIDKPAGMECERRREQANWPEHKRLRQPTIVEALEQRGYRVLPVHRLDRDTSGLMLYALTPPARDRLVAQLARHDIVRAYLAIAVGVVPTVTVHNWIIRDRGDGLRGCVAEPREGANEAISHFRQLEVLADQFTLLECQLETGRTHQIRLHLTSTGHPICGEKLYRSPSPSASPIPDPSNAPRHALHSTRLALTHPTTGAPLAFDSPLPSDLAQLLARLRGAQP